MKTQGQALKGSDQTRKGRQPFRARRNGRRLRWAGGNGARSMRRGGGPGGVSAVLLGIATPTGGEVSGFEKRANEDGGLKWVNVLIYFTEDDHKAFIYFGEDDYKVL